jgi:group I intron endonuclease
MHVVYKHTNRLNGKAYVGFTPKVPIPGLTAEELLHRRWKGHLFDAERGSDLVFHKAIRKHGLEAFDHEILEVCDTLEQVLEREIYWIAEQHTSLDEGGYNMTHGGEGNLMTDGIKLHHRKATSEGTRRARQRPEVVENHRQAMREMCLRPEIREQRSRLQQIVSKRPETREKKSLSLRKAWECSEKFHARRKTTQQIDMETGEVIATYPSARAAERATGISQGNISHCARGAITYAGGFIWRYA